MFETADGFSAYKYDEGKAKFVSPIISLPFFTSVLRLYVSL